MIDVEKILGEKCRAVEERLSELVPKERIAQRRTLDAMRYSLLAGGKRLRPILLTEFYFISGGANPTSALDFACALEMIHTYSLIHDDLPCMDNDDMRRGMPSCHKSFDYATALLAGDALLNRAFEVMADAAGEPEYKLKTISYIGKMSGIYGMVGGQTVDVCENGRLSDIKALNNMVSMKTGALIRGACVGGALLAGAPSGKISRAEEYASKIGLAFQIRDDVLDGIGNRKKLGKNTGSDEKMNKITFFTELGAEECAHRVETLTGEALSAIKGFDDSDFLCALTAWLVRREY